MSEDEHISEQLSAYLDGELDDAAARAVEAAAASDARLAAELAALRKTRDMVRRLPRAKASADFVADVLASAERGKLVDAPAVEAPAPSLKWVRYLATAAVLLITAGVAMVVMTVVLTSAPEGNSGTRSRSANQEGRQAPIAVAARDADNKDKLHEAESLGESEGARDRTLSAAASEPVELAETTGKPVAGPALAPPAPAAPLEDGVIHPAFAKVAVDVSDAGGLVSGADGETIDTDNLDQAVKEVSAILASNGVEPAEPPMAGKKSKEVLLAKERSAQEQFGVKSEPSRSNYYRTQQNSRSQVQIVAMVDPAQEQRVRQALRNIPSQQMNSVQAGSNSIVINQNANSSQGQFRGAIASNGGNTADLGRVNQSADGSQPLARSADQARPLVITINLLMGEGGRAGKMSLPGAAGLGGGRAASQPATVPR